MKLAIIGVTGLVGGTFLKVLEELNFPVTELIPVASEASVGKTVMFKGKPCTVVSLQDAVAMKPAIALFSAGSSVSKEWAPKFAANKTYVIDNSSCWRMFDDIPLMVPEVNGNIVKAADYIIANPNCSTIQLVVALWPLHKAFGIKRIVVSTYQSVTGTGQKAIEQLHAERRGEKTSTVYPHPIDMNCFPHGGSFLDNGYTTEEQKLIDESRKIMQLPGLLVSPTVVRVPVEGGHSEAVNIEFEKPFALDEVYRVLSSAPGIIVQDNPDENSYPMPLYAWGKNEVFVGRIRRDDTLVSGLNIWVVADNLRKGAATNAVQIAELLMKKGYVLP
ncbi:MAG: aspartate-semialdehyde dehydrogenase [Bacteroidetes bacterium HGW-Bacteroidetes-21]|jgi:aspartate-semialdehyde dehydrogenase|nr:MAG: aspartate-semialdehyde dehydrogenase [Bacteroidetes bacterium HGW-Bacteroidetes-21]